MSERGQGVHNGDKRSCGLRQAEIDPGITHVAVDERDLITYRSHERGMYDQIHFELGGRPLNTPEDRLQLSIALHVIPLPFFCGRFLLSPGIVLQ